MTIAHALLRALDRWNHAHPWDHNAHYHRAVLRALPRSAATALDVGCGSGDLARSLAARGIAVTGADADPAILSGARRSTPPGAPVTSVLASAPEGLPDGPFDAVTCLAVLHHLPFADTLAGLRRRLAPGGTLVVVGCYRRATRGDAMIDLPALLLNPLIGWIRNRGRTSGRPLSMTAPTAQPDMAYAQIVHGARRLMPGVRLRRRLFWRYVMVWRAPGEGVPRAGVRGHPW